LPSSVLDTCCPQRNLLQKPPWLGSLGRGPLWVQVTAEAITKHSVLTFGLSHFLEFRIYETSLTRHKPYFCHSPQLLSVPCFIICMVSTIQNDHIPWEDWNFYKPARIVWEKSQKTVVGCKCSLWWWLAGWQLTFWIALAEKILNLWREKHVRPRAHTPYLSLDLLKLRTHCTCLSVMVFARTCVSVALDPEGHCCTHKARGTVSWMTSVPRRTEVWSQ
jgi:hypothetical protein